MVNLGEFDLIRSARRVGRANRYRGAQSAVGRVWYIICIYHYICSSHICPIVLWRGAFTTTFTFRVAGLVAERPTRLVRSTRRPPADPNGVRGWSTTTRPSGAPYSMPKGRGVGGLTSLCRFEAPHVSLKWISAPKPYKTIGILSEHNTYRVFCVPLI